MKKEYSNISKRAVISANAHISHPVTIASNVEIHSSSSIGPYTSINSNTIIYPNVNVGAYCSIARNNEIGAANHPTSYLSVHGFQFTNKHLPNLPGYKEIKRKKWVKGHTKTNIGNDVWIGAKCVIPSGVTIGNGAIIGAGSVVTKDVEPYAIVGGVPAKLIRYRFAKNLIDELLDLNWWELSPLELSGVSFDNIEKAIDEIKIIKNNLN